MARKFPNMPKQPSGTNMMKQAQKMQQDMLALQQEMEQREFDASSGGGAVRAVVTGKKELVSVEISPDALDPEELEMLQDMIVAAVNEALRKAEDEKNSRVESITGGITLPGVF